MASRCTPSPVDCASPGLATTKPTIFAQDITMATTTAGTQIKKSNPGATPRTSVRNGSIATTHRAHCQESTPKKSWQAKAKTTVAFKPRPYPATIACGGLNMRRKNTLLKVSETTTSAETPTNKDPFGATLKFGHYGRNANPWTNQIKSTTIEGDSSPLII